MLDYIEVYQIILLRLDGNQQIGLDRFDRFAGLDRFDGYLMGQMETDQIDQIDQNRTEQMEGWIDRWIDFLIVIVIKTMIIIDDYWLIDRQIKIAVHRS